MLWLLRNLRAALILLSLLLSLTSLVFLIRSLRVTDTLTLRPFPGKWSLLTNSGTLSLSRDRPWLEPDDLRRGVKSQPYEHSFLGFGVKEAQETRTWQGESSRTITYMTTIKTYFIPLWFCTALFSILTLIQLPRIVRHLRRRRLGLCLHCGYDLRASPNKCPECGRPNLRRSTRPRVTILL